MSTTIKLQFNDDIRRVPIEKDKLTYQELVTRITSIYKTIPEGDLPRIVVKYLDNEGDMCTVTSDEELQEAFCSFSSTNQVLKLVISIQEKIENPCKRWKHKEWKERHHDWKEHHQGWKEHHGKGMCQFRKLFREGVTLMEETKYIAARDLFLEQLKEAKSEWQQRIPCYYIACCESLLGNTDSALEYLEKAVNFGFRNLCKIREDPNLNSLRSSAKFQQLVKIVTERKEAKGNDEFRAELRKKIAQEWKNREHTGEGFPRRCHWKKFEKRLSSEKPLEKVEPEALNEKTEKPVVIENHIDEKPVDHKYEKTLATLEEMGFLNRDQNIEALDKVNGDAKLAVSILLQ
jgi:hypothetical protein